MTADEEAAEPAAGDEAGDPVEPEETSEPGAEEEPMRVRADSSPVEDEPDLKQVEDEPEAEPESEPNPYEAGHGAEAAEPGLMGLLIRAGDRLAYEGDRWEARIRDDPQAHPTPPPPPVWVGTFTLAGTEIPWNMHEWSPGVRRSASLVAAAVTSFLVVLGIAAQFLAPGASWFLTLLLVGVVIAFAFELAVFLTAEPRPEPVREPAPAGAAAAGAGAAAGGAATKGETTWEEPDEEPAPPAEDEPLDILTLKCSDCGEVFDVEDHGDRPLTHTCPGCGADGEIPASELPDPADLRDEPEEADEGDEPDAPAGEIPQETGDPIPEFDLDDEDDPA